MQNVDVVITSYHTVASEFQAYLKNNSHSAIFSHTFHRVILDESQEIRNPSTIISKACCSLDATRRWCLTGTPIVNGVGDCFGLMKFLGNEPWSSKPFWDVAITNVMKSKDADDLGNSAGKWSKHEMSLSAPPCLHPQPLSFGEEKRFAAHLPGSTYGIFPVRGSFFWAISLGLIKSKGNEN